MKKFKILIFIVIGLMISLTFSSWDWFVPYAMQPSYYEFKKMCELNNLPKTEEKYNKILSYFGKKLDNSIGTSGYWKKYSNRIDLSVLIHYKNPNDKVLKFDNIKAIYFRPVWKTYSPNMYGNEGNMKFEIKFDGEIDCKKFIGELDG